MLTSHRLLSTATHTGDGAYGAATGRTLRYRILADCHARNNMIDRRMADPRSGRHRAPDGLGPPHLCPATRLPAKGP